MAVNRTLLEIDLSGNEIHPGQLETIQGLIARNNQENTAQTNPSSRADAAPLPEGIAPTPSFRPQ